MNFFSRRKTVDNNNIDCHSKECKNFITEWIGNERWEFNDFADFLRLADIQIPIKVIEFRRNEDAFVCKTSLDEEMTITLHFPDWNEKGYCSWFSVKHGDEIRKYWINSKTAANVTPKVTIDDITINILGKELKCDLSSKTSCTRNLKLNDVYLLEVNITELRDNTDTILKNFKAINDYLLSLDTSLNVFDVYITLMKLLNISINEKGKIFVNIYYSQIKDQKYDLRAKVETINGEVDEYSDYEGDVWYCICKDESWAYVTDNYEICYNADEDDYEFTIKGTEQALEVNPKQIVEKAKNEIDQKRNNLGLNKKR